jgi:hypothetical protein
MNKLLKINIALALIAFLAAGLLFVSGFAITGKVVEISPTGMAVTDSSPICTADAKICLDGSYVTRTGPSCEFAPCPGCQTLWWFDNTHRTCAQKQFCGTYMYQGLNTFQTKTECEVDLNLVQCAAEGETIPVIANPPECCSNLKLIKPKLENQLGIYGYCTAKCGNDICESETESSYNCPEDCKDIVTCNSCFDCTSKINRAKSGTVVKLVNDIEGDNVYLDQWGTEYYNCISWTGGNSNVTFDCDGHKIKERGKTVRKEIVLVMEST